MTLLRQYGLLSRHLWARLLQQNLHRRMRSSHPALRSDSIFLCEVLLYIIILDWRLAIINQLNRFPVQYQLQLPDDADSAGLQSTDQYNQCQQQRFCTSLHNKNSVYIFGIQQKNASPSAWICTTSYFPKALYKAAKKRRTYCWQSFLFYRWNGALANPCIFMLFCHIPLR